MTRGIRTVSDRPRSRRAHALVIEATAHILATEGFRAVAVDRIARESGVSTATIYKHWPSKTAIAAEAFGTLAARAVEAPRSGDPVEDLVETAVATITFYAREGAGAAFRELLAGCALEPEGAAYFRAYFLQPRRDELAPLWRRAAAAGQVRDDLDPDEAMDVLFGPAAFVLLTRAAPVGADEVRRLVIRTLRGLGA
ncbi:TetR/AcrR family transcriptional regulator [Streptomyces tremellae]|uniref:TetR/AcrR family transcriptional regulator n=1 Tax=Streptomyces tremellae TaxID=1124239 RepID=A0ABP7F0T7_9ACTN